METVNDYKNDSKPNYCPLKGTGCYKEITQSSRVTVPFEIKPKATVGKIRTECCGDPLIISKPSGNNSCIFEISQKIVFHAEIKYEVETEIGKNKVECCECENA